MGDEAQHQDRAKQVAASTPATDAPTSDVVAGSVSTPRRGASPRSRVAPALLVALAAPLWTVALLHFTGHRSWNGTPAEMALWPALACGPFGLAALVLARLSPMPWTECLGLGPSRLPLSVVPALLVATLAIAHAGVLLVQRPWPTGLSTTYWTWPPLQGASPAWKVAVLGSVMLFPGVCEEAFVRGYVQRRLLLRWPPLAAILYSSVIFAAWHLQPANVLAVLPGGLWLGYVAWRADSIRPTVAAHAVWGGALYVVRTSETLVSAAEHAAFTPTLSVLGLACAALTVLALERSARRDPRPGPTPGTPPAPPPPPPGPGGR